MLDHFESDAVLCGGLGRLLARVSLIDVGQLDVLPGRFLYLLGELLELLSVVLVGRSDAHSEQVSQSVHRRMHLRALLVLMSVVAAPRAALGGRPQSERVHYGRRRLRSPLLRKPQKYAQIVDHLLEHSRLEPSLRLLVDGFPQRQVVGHVSPRRAGAYDPPQPVQDLAKIVLALGGVLSDECEVWGHERPLFVRNVTGVWFSSSHDRMLSCTG